MADSNPTNGGGQPINREQQARLWSLANLQMPLQSRFPRSAIAMAHELLPNLPRRVYNSALQSAANAVQQSTPITQSPSSRNGDGGVVVDMSPLMSADDDVGESMTLSPQMMARMEEIRSLLQNMNSQQQHGHAHNMPDESSPEGTGANHLHPHTHAHSHGAAAGGGEAQGPPTDIRSLLKLVQTSGVFFVLLLLRFLYDHRLGLIVMLAMGGTFYYVNMKLVQCIHQTAVREVGSGRLMSLAYPLWLIVFLTVNILLLYYSFEDQALWNSLVYRMPHVSEVDIWTLLWIVLLTDFVVKFATVALKCCIFLLPAACLPHRRRGKFYMFVEKVSQLYRLTLPILPWVHYLQDDQEIGRWFAIATVVIYCMFKVGFIWKAFLDVVKSSRQLKLHSTFGSKPGAEELRQRGTTCPICQDEFKEPILLVCKHIFCENCVSLWFDREKTCPMCRAQITDDPQWQDGSTTPSLQWY